MRKKRFFHLDTITTTIYFYIHIIEDNHNDAVWVKIDFHQYTTVNGRLKKLLMIAHNIVFSYHKGAFMGWFNKKELTEIGRLKGIIARLEAENNAPYLPMELSKARDRNSSRFYKSKDFFTPKERMLFEKLLAVITGEDFKQEFAGAKFFIFPKVRLMDIIEQKEKSWSEFKVLKTNEDVVRTIMKTYPSFGEKEYRELIIDSALKTHVDFLICNINEDKIMPILVIELHSKGDKKGYYDILKESALKLFNVKKVSGLWVIKNEELDDNDFAEKLQRDLIEKLKRLS